jgi:hypothetical protein
VAHHISSISGAKTIQSGVFAGQSAQNAFHCDTLRQLYIAWQAIGQEFKSPWLHPMFPQVRAGFSALLHVPRKQSGTYVGT